MPKVQTFRSCLSTSVAGLRLRSKAARRDVAAREVLMQRRFLVRDGPSLLPQMPVVPPPAGPTFDLLGDRGPSLIALLLPL